MVTTRKIIQNHYNERWSHCVKNIQIRTRKNSLFGHFSHSVRLILLMQLTLQFVIATKSIELFELYLREFFT